MRTWVTLLCLAALAFAQEPPKGAPKELKRGFAEGKFVDEYFGIAYEAPGLEKGYGSGGPTVLFSGALPDGVDVEISVVESTKEMTAKEWRDDAKQQVDQAPQKPAEMAEGDDPVAWISFVQESLSGMKRHHGIGFFARGLQAVLVHATVSEKSETSGEALKKAFGYLKLSDAPNSFLYVHLTAKQAQKALDDPMVLASAGMAYGRNQPPMPLQALKVSKLAEKSEASLPPDAQWTIAQTIGIALLTLNRNEESLPYWKKAIELSPKTMQPESNASNAHYNLACAYSKLGRLDEAFAELKTALASKDPAINGALRDGAPQDPDFEPLRKDPRWAEIFPAR